MWGPRLLRIVKEVGPFYEYPFLGTLADPWRTKALWYRDSAFDHLFILQLYFVGFDAVKGGHAPAGASIQDWVNRANRAEKLALQSCIFASGLCSLLEALLPEMAGALGVQEYKRIRRVRTLPRDPSEARKQLRKWANPTSKGDSGWSERVGDVFGFSASDDVHLAIRTMLDLRHTYIHDHVQAMKHEMVIDELSSWVYASILLTTLAARSVSQT